MVWPGHACPPQAPTSPMPDPTPCPHSPSCRSLSSLRLELPPPPPLPPLLPPPRLSRRHALPAPAASVLCPLWSAARSTRLMIQRHPRWHLPARGAAPAAGQRPPSRSEGSFSGPAAFCLLACGQGLQLACDHGLQPTCMLAQPKWLCNVQTMLGVSLVMLHAMHARHVRQMHPGCSCTRSLATTRCSCVKVVYIQRQLATLEKWAQGVRT